jgi:hypothetical protein
MSSKELELFDLEETPDWEFDDQDLGLGYAKKELLNHKSVWAIYNGRGELLSHAPTRQTALVIMRQNDMTPHMVH